MLASQAVLLMVSTADVCQCHGQRGHRSINVIATTLSTLLCLQHTCRIGGATSSNGISPPHSTTRLPAAAASTSSLKLPTAELPVSLVVDAAACCSRKAAVIVQQQHEHYCDCSCHPSSALLLRLPLETALRRSLVGEHFIQVLACNLLSQKLAILQVPLGMQCDPTPQ